jgi:hypothetical protein
VRPAPEMLQVMIAHALRKGTPARRQIGARYCRVAVVAFIACVAALIADGVAYGKMYRAYTCRLPDGRPAGTSGWRLFRHAGDIRAGNECARGGALYIRFGPGVQAWGPQADWIFEPPPDTRIAMYAIYRYVRIHSRSSPPTVSEYELTENDLGGPMADNCQLYWCPRPGNPGSPLDSGNRVMGGGGDPRRLVLDFQCRRSDAGGGCPGWGDPGLYVYAGHFLLIDDFAPAIASITGDLLSPGAVYGTRSLMVRATDRGGGIRSVALEVDGQPRPAVQLSQATKQCSEPFAEAQPCPLSGSSRLGLDTTALPDGFHAVSIVVRDVAGNVTRSTPYTIAVDNGGGTCVYGSGPSLRVGFGRHYRARVRVRAGRKVVVRGILRSRTARPISSAAVRILAQRRGALRFREAGVVRTSDNGHFRLTLKPGPTRRVRASYCAVGGGVARDIRLRVTATGRLRSNRRRVRNGGSVLFHGRVLARPFPSFGKLVELQAYFRGRWRTFQTLRTNRRGAFRFRYRFGGTTGRIRYRFRVRIPREAGYPYEAGASRSVSVLVRGA